MRGLAAPTRVAPAATAFPRDIFAQDQTAGAVPVPQAPTTDIKE